jgi:Protein of unknown function (DUF2877)
MKSSSISQNTLSTQFSFPIIEASSVGQVAYSRLREKGEGIIHGVFRTAINILFHEGLVSLVPEAVERGPLNVILRLPNEQLSSLFSLQVKTGDKVNVHGSSLKLGDRTLISFASARIYSPNQKFTMPMLPNNEIEANLKVMRKTATLFGNNAGLGELLATTLGPIEATANKLNIFSAFALRRIVQFEQAFHSEKKKALKAAISELIGLGPGLTPSSDDMLAGLILLCVLYAKNSGVSQRTSQLIAKVTLKEARGKTTILSEEYLRQAASGRGNEPIMRLLEALLTGSRESVERETRSVLSIGETSGTDTVLGIALGTMLCINKQTNLAEIDFE